LKLLRCQCLGFLTPSLAYKESNSKPTLENDCGIDKYLLPKLGNQKSCGLNAAEGISVDILVARINEFHFKELVNSAHQAYWISWIECLSTIDNEGLKVGDRYCIFFAERMLMQKHARQLLAESNNLDVLEIGFGLGLFAEEASAIGVKSHTIVELHPEIANRARVWGSTTPNPDSIEIINLPWQLMMGSHRKFDAIMLDANSPNGFLNSDFENFIDQFCPRHLRPGGLLTFFNNGTFVTPEKEGVLARSFTPCQRSIHKLQSVPVHWQQPSDEFLVATYTFQGK